MATVRPRFRDRAFYHVYNRGVEKRKVFMNDKDRFRFIHDLYEFNDVDAVVNSGYYSKNYWGPTPIDRAKQRKMLVDILAYALMPNHYHILLRQRRKDGVSLFMKKLGAGYTGYFNSKYERSGALFQGRYKVKEVDEDRYLRYLVTYIHLNPVELFAPGWKEKGIANSAKTLRQLKEYRWSSYRDYMGEKNFPSVLNLDLARNLSLPLGEETKSFVADWLTTRERYDPIVGDIIIE